MTSERFCREDRLILQLCRRAPDYGFVLGEIRPSCLDLRRLIRTAHAQGLAPLVLDRLLRQPLAPDAREALRGFGRREIVSVLHDNVIFRSELTRLVRKLRQRSIEVILLKGLSLDFSHLRCMGDIDLMIPENRLADAIDAVLELDGYFYRRMRRDGPDESFTCREGLPQAERRRVLGQLTWNNEFHLHNSTNSVLVELHHKLFQIRNPDGRFMENIEGVLRSTSLFWQYRQHDPVLGCFTLSLAHSLLLACLRNAIKQQPANNSFRLSNLVDVDNLVAAGIPWPAFLRDCHALKIAAYVLFSLKLAKQLLGTPIPLPVLHELAEACTPAQLRALSIHCRCVTSLDFSSAFYSKLYKGMSPFAFGGTLRQKLLSLTLVPVWLPSRVQMASFFGLRKDSPLIPLAYLANPVRWVVRILRALIRR